VAKRRTRKQKEGAKHNLAFLWKPITEIQDEKPCVKGQFNLEASTSSVEAVKNKNAINLAKDSSLSVVKRDIVKSLILASLILALEVMVYLAWNK
jgi:hypothetical protein